jgi:hypothetical protein
MMASTSVKDGGMVVSSLETEYSLKLFKLRTLWTSEYWIVERILAWKMSFGEKKQVLS